MPFSFLRTAGGEAILASNSPGFCYVPPLEKFAAWSGGADVYTLDVTSGQWTRHAAAPTNRVIPGPPDQWGTFGRFRYVPSRNLFILYNAVKQNVFIYRLTADRPNVITGVEAKLTRPTVEGFLPTPAISVRAIYADGTSKDVTAQASYFSLDPTIAEVGAHGGGAVVGLAAGIATVRTVYTDPAFKRGFSADVRVFVKDITPDSTLDALRLDFEGLTLAPGEPFQLQALGSYTRGSDHFQKSVTAEVNWSSDAPDVATITKGLIKPLKKGGPLAIRASLGTRSIVTHAVVTDDLMIRRINFQVKETFEPPRLALR